MDKSCGSRSRAPACKRSNLSTTKTRNKKQQQKKNPAQSMIQMTFFGFLFFFFLVLGLEIGTFTLSHSLHQPPFL
jgi:hypothetical protein